MNLLTFKPQTARVANPRLSDIFDNLLDQEFPIFSGREFSGNAPLVNIKETPTQFQIDLAAPGFAKENIKIQIEGNLMHISGEVKENKLEEGEKFTRKEFSFQVFKRSFTLPKNVLADKTDAAFENGILKITLTKVEELKTQTSKEVSIR